jgi:uncharacterized membrane protein required for colicin V production
MLLADGLLQQWGDLGAIAVVIALALVGMKSGLFVATLWGMAALVAVMAGLACLDRVAAWLQMAEIAPVYLPAASFFVTAAVVAVGLRLAVGALVEEDEVRFPPLVDTLGGLAVGALGGVIAAGGLQLLLSMAPLPSWMGRLDPRRQMDLGGPLLESFARWAAADDNQRSVILNGEPGLKFDPTAVEKPAATPQEEVERKLNPWKNSEVFADLNLNGGRDEDEPFLDADGDGQFSEMTDNSDANGNRLRDIGLLERYRLGPWLTVSVSRKLPPNRDGEEGAPERLAATLAGAGQQASPPTTGGTPTPPAPPPVPTPPPAVPPTPLPPAAPPAGTGDKEKPGAQRVVIRVTAASAFDAEGATSRLAKKLDVVGSTWKREGTVTVIVLPYRGKLKDVIAALTAEIGLVSKTDPDTRTIDVTVE